MTVSVETTKISYSCTGSLSDFDFSFPIFSESDLTVLLTDSDGTETELTLNVNYEVEPATPGDYSGGGTVSTIDAEGNPYAYSSDYTLTIIRDAAYTQETDYTAGDRFPAQAHENALDKLTMLVQQLKEIMDRGPRFKRSSGLSEIELPVEASKVFGLNASGDGIQMYSPTAITDNTPDVIDDASADASAMQSIEDPFPSGAPSLATSLREELQRLRYLIKQITGMSQWYYDASGGGGIRPARDSARTLVVTKYSSAPTTTMNITADELILQDSNGAIYRAGPGLVGRPDITASGANGLDTGSEATGVYYYIWIISDGSTVTGLLSLSKTSPTMPSGYTYKALVGQVFNSAGGDFEEYGTWDGRNFLDLQQAYTLVSSLGPGSESEVVLAPGSTYANLSTRGLIIIVRGSVNHKVSWKAIGRTSTFYDFMSGGWGTAPSSDPTPPASEHRVAIRVRNNHSSPQDVYIKVMAVGFLS